jgi:RES domain-containing protein
MIIYRLTVESFKKDLTGNGSKLFGGRWNAPGFPAIYTSENISLAVLEILVNADKKNIPPAYFLLKLSVPDELPVRKISLARLKEKWYSDFEYSQFIGSNFLKAGKEAILKVPSSVIKDEHNFILNPAHADFKKISITESVPFDFDIRLLKPNE